MMIFDQNVFLSITWDRFDAIVSSEGIFCILRDGLYQSGPQDIRISRFYGSQHDVLRMQSRVNIPRDIFDKLNNFAQKTYAPATEVSRLAGAGAGLNDND